MPTLDIDYTPNDRQKIFHSSAAEEVVYGGAKGGGKTCALVMEAAAYAMEYAGAKIYLFRETYDDLEANVIEEWLSKIPSELYDYNASKHIATLHNGTRIFFRYIRNDEDAKKYQGRSMDFIGVDELTKHSEKAIQILLSCLRSPKGFPAVFKGTCNPGGKGHLWVKKRYITPTQYGEKTIEDDVTENRIEFIPAKVYDNDVLMENDPAYVKRLENLPEAQRRAFLYGDWDVLEGQYFDEWRNEIHTCKPFEIPHYWKKFRSLDYGLDCTACYWWAVDQQGKLYIYRELWEEGLKLSDAAKKIIRATPTIERDEISYTVASPDLWNRRQETGFAGEELMRKAARNIGHHLNLTKADNRRVPGWRAVREYLAPYQDEQDIETAKVQIFDDCIHLTESIPGLLHDENNPEDVADEPHILTHSAESIRYGIMSRPPLKSLTEQEKRDRGRDKRRRNQRRNKVTGY